MSIVLLLIERRCSNLKEQLVKSGVCRRSKCVRATIRGRVRGVGGVKMFEYEKFGRIKGKRPPPPPPPGLSPRFAIGESDAELKTI